MIKKIFSLIAIAILAGICAQAILGPVFGNLVAPNAFILAFAIILYKEHMQDYLFFAAIIFGYFAEIYGVLPAGGGILIFPFLFGLFLLSSFWFSPLGNRWQYGALVVIVWQMLFQVWLVLFGAIGSWLNLSLAANLATIQVGVWELLVVPLISAGIYILLVFLGALFSRLLPRRQSGIIKPL